MHSELAITGVLRDGFYVSFGHIAKGKTMVQLRKMTVTWESGERE